MKHVFPLFRAPGAAVRRAAPLRRAAGLLLVCVLLFASACASNKAGLKSPELPARHWLEETPGVPVENRSKLEAAVPNLYDASKQFTFEDCVFLTIQQSPLLVNSAVDLEIKRVALTNAVWKYLPEPRMTLTLTNNLTRHNMDTYDTPGDYGRTKLRPSFHAAFPNPVATYFEHQVQRALLNMAISTHRKAVGEVIYKIAQSYLKLEAQRRILGAQKELLPLGKNLVAYWQQVEVVEGRQGVALNVATQHQRERELTVEKTNMQEVMERTQLKIIAGVEPQQRLNVDAESARNILEGFNGHALRWEDRWSATEDDLLLRAQVKLGDFNIMVAWAAYVPDMTIRINNDPPAGQYQPPRGEEDTFFHLDFDFPLIDWGRRYLDVQTARMRKAQAFHEMARKRTEYSNKWLQAEQRVALAETELKLQKTRLDTAEMQYKEARIAFEEGTVELPDMVQSQEAAANARIAHIQAELEYKLAQLEWMQLANVLQERFLGLPAKEIL
ncbi:MAG: TolC family protein [Desulfovibrio sp.]|nr:TolC family protein [Desulfovibrio sp.]